MDDNNLPATLPEVSAEMAAIEREMPTPAYRQDEALQARYRDLVTRREELANSAPAPEAEGDGVLRIFSPSEAQSIAPGADYATYFDASRQAADVLMGATKSARAELVGTFEALPDEVAAHMVGELVNRAFVSIDELSEIELAVFASEPVGQILVPVWGRDTPQKAAKVRARLMRMVDGMDENEADTFLDWLDDLSPAAAAAVYRKLGE